LIKFYLCLRLIFAVQSEALREKLHAEKLAEKDKIIAGISNWLCRNLFAFPDLMCGVVCVDRVAIVNRQLVSQVDRASETGSGAH
jgi:hypothetical protein